MTLPKVRLGLHGWYVDGEPVTEQRAYETLDFIDEIRRQQTE